MAATLNETERAARVQELNRKFNTDWNKGAGEIFDDTQRTRHQQLNYQYGGFITFSDPDVQTRLKFTPEPIKSLRDHTDWGTRQLHDVHRIGANDATKGTTMYRDYGPVSNAIQHRLDPGTVEGVGYNGGDFAGWGNR